jgi:hypothetical protein
MAQGKSLVDESGMGSIGAPKVAVKKNESGKLMLAVALFLIAGVVVAWTSGIFTGEPKPVETITPEQQQAQQVQQQRTEETVKAKKGNTGGTD